MARGPLNKYEHSELGPALEWLRRRVSLTQEEVAERTQSQGTSLSSVYYSQIERGKSPSVPMLEGILGAVGSDFDELEGLLAHKPWATSPQLERKVRMSRSAPKSPLYDLAAPVKAALATTSARPLATTRTPPPENDTPSISTLVKGEAAELADIYAQLPRQDQLNLMQMAKSRDPRRRYSR
jgi:transcriptional regulator with XRE-family HTH domain